MSAQASHHRKAKNFAVVFILTSVFLCFGFLSTHLRSLPFFSSSNLTLDQLQKTKSIPTGINFPTRDNRNSNIERNLLTGAVSTVAGDGTKTYGADGGLATATGLHEPSNVAFDAIGNMYIADSLNSRIRLVMKGTGIISTVAGKGAKAYTGDGGPATLAELGQPRCVVLDAEGNLFIADTDNHCIRKVTKSSGVITTVAGTGVAGFNADDQLATTARLTTPYGVAVDAEGNLYIADTYNHRIRKVTKSTGFITTLAGTGVAGFDGTPGPADKHPLSSPLALILDAAGNIIFSDSNNNCVRMVSKSTKELTIIAGLSMADYGGDNGLATDAYLSFPAGLALDGAGNLYIADSANNVIRYVAKSTGYITTVAGDGKAGLNIDGAEGLSASRFSSPLGVTLDGTGHLYIADTNNHLVRSVATEAQSQAVFPRATSVAPTTAPITMSPSPTPVAIVTQKPTKTPTVPISAAAGSGLALMYTLAGDGNQNAVQDNVSAKETSVSEPTGVAVDADGNVYIADGLHHRIRLVTKSTGLITTYAGKGPSGAFSGDNGPATAGELNLPRCVVLDSAGNLFIADTDNHRVRKVTKSSGVITTVAGTGVAGFNADDQLATLAHLFSPNGVAVDSDDNLYIADTYNHRIRKVTKSTGIITTVAGDGFQGLGGQLATNAGLYYPFNIALDAEGNIYIADSYNNEIRKVERKTGFISTPVGLTTASGAAAAGFAGDGGDAKLASVSTPTGIALDAGGNIFIADFGNNAIRLWTKDTGIITTVAGRGTSVTEGIDADLFRLNGPVNINISPSGVLYISDTNANYIRTFAPKLAPTSAPTSTPTLEPSSAPTEEPSEGPTIKPSRKPSREPTLMPTDSPVFNPTRKPSASPTEQPTYYDPTLFPTESPDRKNKPTESPDRKNKPTESPDRKNKPTESPDKKDKPTKSPSMATSYPTVKQSSRFVTNAPSKAPNMPSGAKTARPTKRKCPCRTVKRPSCAPTVIPPTDKPVVQMSKMPMMQNP